MKRKIKRYKVSPDESLGLAFSVVNSPAVESDFQFFSEQKLEKFVGVEGERRMIYGCALRPDFSIYRNNGGEEYYLEFDADAIDRMDMDAEQDGVMKAVWLQDPVRDYGGIDPVSGKKHIYGCSGIDATALGPVFGGTDEKLMIGYGVYSDTQRQDNDHQVLLQFDPSVIDRYAKPLCQEKPHHSGPEKAEQHQHPDGKEGGEHAAHHKRHQHL